jgi:aspartyl-tRNA(Asn)/glutamyl-tRNA(Gln) amidotransferase subunit C
VSPDVDRDRILDLARLTLSPGDTLPGHLSTILEYVATLEMADTRAIPPSHSVLRPTAHWHDDIPGEPLSQDEALRSAPDREEGFFRCPRVI